MEEITTQDLDYFVVPLFGERFKKISTADLSLHRWLGEFISEGVGDMYEEVTNNFYLQKIKNSFLESTRELFRLADTELALQRKVSIEIPKICIINVVICPKEEWGTVEFVDFKGKKHDKFSDLFSECAEFSLATENAFFRYKLRTESYESQQYEQWLDFSVLISALKTLPGIKINEEKLVDQLLSNWIHGTGEHCIGEVRDVKIKLEFHIPDDRDLDPDMRKKNVLKDDGLRRKFKLHGSQTDALLGSPARLPEIFVDFSRGKNYNQRSECHKRASSIKGLAKYLHNTLEINRA